MSEHQDPHLSETTFTFEDWMRGRRENEIAQERLRYAEAMPQADAILVARVKRDGLMIKVLENQIVLQKLVIEEALREKQACIRRHQQSGLSNDIDINRRAERLQVYAHVLLMDSVVASDDSVGSRTLEAASLERIDALIWKEEESRRAKKGPDGGLRFKVEISEGEISEAEMGGEERTKAEITGGGKVKMETE